MKSGYNIVWTSHALNELERTIEYLEINFSKKELGKLAQKIETIANLISQSPRMFNKSDKNGIYRVTILRYNTLYYRIKGDNVEILSFFSNRQNPKLKKMYV